MFKHHFFEIKKIFTKADIFLIIFLLILSFVSLYSFSRNLSRKYVEIYYHNQLIGKYKLDKTQVITVDEGIVVEIKDGKVRMKESTCKNQFCVKQGWIKHFPIVCVPNEVLILFRGKIKKEMLITR
jgi:hypothetical protein